MIDKRTKRKVDRFYKHWLEEQVEDDPTITAICKHCHEKINLADGGFMSWHYGELAEHLENECEEVRTIANPDFEKRPDGFNNNDHSYGYSG
jgi:hypothetical protein